MSRKEVEDARRNVLWGLSLKWKDLQGNDIRDTPDFTWLVDRGLIEIGTDVRVEAETSGDSAHGLYLLTGRNARVEIRVCAVLDAGLEEPKRFLVQPALHLFYCRLTDAGLAARKSDRLPRRSIAFRAELVECFDERETDEEKKRFEADQSRYLYVRSSLKEPHLRIPFIALQFRVTRNGIRRRVTSEEYARLNPGLGRVVVGQDYEDFQRELIAGLWPDLAEAIELQGSVSSFSQAFQRMKDWSGIGIPSCHRDWRALSEWAGLEPDKITEDWLRDRLYPRLLTMWLKQAQEGQNEADNDEQPPGPAGRLNAAGRKPATPPAEVDADFKYDDEWLTVSVCEQRFGLNRKSLTRWATAKCPYFDGRLLRRRTFPPDQNQWCYHRGDVEAIRDAQTGDEQDAA